MASSLLQRAFMRQAITLLGEAARRQADINLQTMAQDDRRAQALRNDLRLNIINVGDVNAQAFVEVDFYWALYYHDGRGPIDFGDRPGRFMVFYRNPRRDPRTQGGTDYPRRADQVRKLRLSKGEFRRLLASGQLIATKRVGSADPHPFFERGFANAAREAGDQINELFRQLVLRCLREDDLLNPPEEIAEFEL